MSRPRTSLPPYGLTTLLLPRALDVPVLAGVDDDLLPFGDERRAVPHEPILEDSRFVGGGCGRSSHHRLGLDDLRLDGLRKRDADRLPFVELHLKLQAR